MSMLTIGIIAVVVLGLVCCGACGACLYFGASTVATQMRDPVMSKIQTSQEVKDKLGEPLTAGFPTSTKAENITATIEFPVTGPKGTAQVYAELEMGPNGYEPTTIRVTPPDGTIINVPTGNDPTNIEFPDFDNEGGIEMDDGAE